MQRCTFNRKQLIVSGMVCFLAMSIPGISSGQTASLVEAAQPVTPKQATNSGQLTDAQKLFRRAYAAYCKARPMTALGAGSEPYAEAVSAIAQAVTLEPENVDYLLLASQIYRGKGGISYARQYFSRAETVLQDCLAENPDAVQANLDYAILCYAGDARYWPNYDIYLKTAKKHAEHIISLFERNHREIPATDSLALALAYLIKGNSKECEKRLEAIQTPAGQFYCELYRDTVKKNKWYWPVKDAEKEFLLYYMTDIRRHTTSYT